MDERSLSNKGIYEAKRGGSKNSGQGIGYVKLVTLDLYEADDPCEELQGPKVKGQGFLSIKIIICNSILEPFCSIHCGTVACFHCYYIGAYMINIILLYKICSLILIFPFYL